MNEDDPTQTGGAQNTSDKEALVSAAVEAARVAEVLFGRNALQVILVKPAKNEDEPAAVVNIMFPTDDPSEKL